MKLKSLTVSGFKSFADKTAFDFHDGVTCIVGPNGCGKSNVVDAVKWVLGEQSAKSLRGGEMLDVIFNGTATRRSAGFAEVTLAFEDAAGVLGQGPEGPKDHAVAISRRLYRSGESEYLINNVVARLKDIREMFLDTGVGADAYSLIEQGKVETFLQASVDERRAVFDEAAGISRYKVRRREALRRLERVEQNLLRLSDVLNEVAKRLRSIKYQAGKARSYQQYTARLRELRSLYALAEYHRLSCQRRDLQVQADAATDALAQLTAQTDRLEASRTASETDLSDLERKAHDLDGRIAQLSSQIVACQQRAEMLSVRAGELSDAVVADSSRCEQLEAKFDAHERELAGHRKGLECLTVQLSDLTGQDRELRARHTAGQQRVEDLRRRLEDEKNGTIDLLRRTAQLHNEVQTHCLRRENLHVQRQKLVGQADQLARALEELLTRRGDVHAKLDDVRAVLVETQARLEQSHQQAQQLDQDAQGVSAELSAAQQRHSALASRQALLEEMQRKLEGIGEGVRKVIAAAQQGAARFVRGMLGDLIEVDVSHAGVIETALGGAEQRLLADRLEDVLTAAGPLRELLADTGGAELVCLDQLGSAGVSPVSGGTDVPPVSLPDDPAIVARAMDWVCCPPWVAPAVEMLLGRTLVVPSLHDACRLRRAVAAGWRFVTLTGEVLEADGRIRVGPGARVSGVVWRRSELADLARRMQQNQAGIDGLERRLSELEGRRKHAQETIHSLRTAIYEAQTERVEHETVGEHLDKQVAELQRNQPLLAEEVRQLAEEIDSAVRQEHQAKEQAAELETLRAQREAEVAALNAELAQAEQGQAALSAEVTAAQVALAETRQKHAGLEETVARLTGAGEALTQELLALRERIEQSRRRKAEAEAEAAEARRQAERCSAGKAALAEQVKENDESRAGLQQRLADIRDQLADRRKRHDELSGQLNALRVQLGEVEVRVENLIARTNEELGIDLPACYARQLQLVRQGAPIAQPQHAPAADASSGDAPPAAPPEEPRLDAPIIDFDQPRDWQAVQQEIADLRSKIERLGNINLDAIAEQDELQQREKFLSDQVEDVRASQRQLTDLIRRLNAESKTRFEESFQTVRGLFNDLFRKLFGGGKADILLTNPEDVLESPIEIVARPPGKELRSITLMSGGEKTMTALALLFSFFKARPSPFCLLDEVDAALDEANTQRFGQLVKEFLASSQFVVISHSKRTIAMADQIYGVTMQEPGVSRKISVRFEDATKLVEEKKPQAASA